jgi:hypothetical protein
MLFFLVRPLKITLLHPILSIYNEFFGLKALQEKLNISKPIASKKEEIKLGKCRICKKGIMETIFAFSKTRPPPKSFLKQ